MYFVLLQMSRNIIEENHRYALSSFLCNRFSSVASAFSLLFKIYSHKYCLYFLAMLYFDTCVFIYPQKMNFSKWSIFRLI